MLKHKVYRQLFPFLSFVILCRVPSSFLFRFFYVFFFFADTPTRTYADTSYFTLLTSLFTLFYRYHLNIYRLTAMPTMVMKLNLSWNPS